MAGSWQSLKGMFEVQGRNLWNHRPLPKMELLRSPHFIAFPKFPILSLLRSFKPQNGRGAATGFAAAAAQSCNFSSAADVSEFERDELHDDSKTVEKHNALSSALSRLAGDFGSESILSLQRFFGSRRLPVISTGSLRLDMALGVGGLPKGRIVEIFGQEASGKTTLALHIIKEAQKLGGYCAYLDVENAMNPSLLESMGVDTENLLISQPDSAENLLCMVDTLIKSGSIDVIVIDSVAALIPGQCIDALAGESYRISQSRIMTQALRKIQYSLCNFETLVIFINQVRCKVTSDKGFKHAEVVTCGGNALPFYAAVRLRIFRTGLLKMNDEVTGLKINVQVMKNKLATPMKKADIEIMFGKGICCVSEVLELASEYSVISRENGHYLMDGRVFRTKQEAEGYLAKNTLRLEELVKSLRTLLFEEVK